MAPPHHVCRRCSNKGHYEYNCPTQGDPAYDVQRVVKMTGIPRTFLQNVESSAGAGVWTDGSYVKAVPQSYVANMRLLLYG